jgi:glyceraldehyde 3-phosphate dehydrogenase
MKQPIRIGINGFGRIGRCFTRLVAEHPDLQLEIVSINDLGNEEAMAHLLEFDSIHGRSNLAITFGPGLLNVNGHEIAVSHHKDPAQIPWAGYQIDVVLEATGKFKSAQAVQGHLEAGAPRVIISAVPAGEPVKTIVMGANEHLLDGAESIISNASCTTNCAAPLLDIIDKMCTIESGYITTVHSYTSDQTLHDTAHSDLRRARAAGLSIIPTTTGAAKAVTKIFPHLDGKLGGAGIRVPVPNGSLTDITFTVKESPNVAELNALFASAAAIGPWSPYLEYTEKPLVSVDVIGNPHSCIFDAQLTSVIGNMVKVVGWYDNEMGYTHRLMDLIRYWSKLWS